ncbi:MAG: DUF998 domain-containing protein [Thermotogaceae bacterium]|nr:DUF998 domain-containing protein [Thermotogaceae bacterium]
MKVWKYLGLISMSIFWIFTFISIHLNPWFDISRCTFSKLGKIGLANYPWVFSAGTMIGGIFMICYGIEIIRNTTRKLQTVGGSYVLLSGVFMMLVGLFPDGTKPHDFIALSTFLLFYTGIMLFGVGNSKKSLKLSTTLVFIMALAGLLCPCWASLGYLEIYGLILVIFDIILLLAFA